MSAWDKKEEKKIAEEVKPSVQPEEKSQNLIVHSELDAYVMDRIKSQPQTREEVDIQVMEKPKDGYHALSLPEEIKKYAKEYAFCWIFKRKQAMDEARDLNKWVFVTRNHFQDLPNHLFTARGVMERGDSILMYRSKKMDEEMRKAPGIESTNRIKQQYNRHKDDPQFYVPKEDEETIVLPTGEKIKVPVQGI